MVVGTLLLISLTLLMLTAGCGGISSPPATPVVIVVSGEYSGRGCYPGGGQ
jgi:hypothetical protein